MNGEQTQESEIYDVCVVGGGPVGAYLTLRLAQAGLTVRTFEALFELPDEPRAFPHQPGLFKEYESAGILKPMQEISFVQRSGLFFRRKTDLEIIEQIKPKPGLPPGLALPQKEFTEKILLEKLKEYPSGQILHGSKVIGIQSGEDKIDIEVENVQNGSTHTYSCKYLVGADGSKSTVRRVMNIRYEGVTLPYKLIASNIVFPFEQHGFEASNFILDPEDFGMVAFMRTTPEEESLWRVSTAFPIDMSDDEIVNSLPEKLQRLVKHLTPGEYRVANMMPYKARQFSTPIMVKGRMMLVGDAAHLVNPYSGQLLATGILDASSLAKCLVSILRHNTPPSLLEEWGEARVAVAKNVLDPLSRGCLAAVSHPDVDSIGERHPFLKAIKLGPRGGPLQMLETDVMKLKSWQPHQNGENSGADKLKVNGVKN